MILLDIMNKPDEQKRGINIHPYVLIYKLTQRQPALMYGLSRLNYRIERGKEFIVTVKTLFNNQGILYEID